MSNAVGLVVHVRDLSYRQSMVLLLQNLREKKRNVLEYQTDFSP